MKFNATIEIDELKLRHILEEYFEQNGIKGISDPDIIFVVEEVERGDQRDHWTVHELTKVQIKNVKVGIEK